MDTEKVELKKTEDQQESNAESTKMLEELFRIAEEFAKEDGASIAIIAKAPVSGAFYAYGSPSVELVVEELYEYDGTKITAAAVGDTNAEQQEHEVEELESNVENMENMTGTKKRKMEWSKSDKKPKRSDPIVENFTKKLEELKNVVERLTENLHVQDQGSSLDEC